MKLMLLMILGHLVADYTLQGWLADAKQIAWWRKQTSDPKYRHDWIAGLVCHSLYWSLLTFLPLYNWTYWPSIVIDNAIIHAAIDHAKANMRLVNLWQDQCLHLVQILSPFAVQGVLA